MGNEAADCLAGIYRAYTYIRKRFIREPVAFRLHRVDLEALYDQHKDVVADDRTFDEAMADGSPVAVLGVPTALDNAVRPGTIQVTVEMPLVLIGDTLGPFLQPDYIAAPVNSGEIALMRREGGVTP